MQHIVPYFIEALAAICLYAAIAHFFIWRKSPEIEREHLAFSTLCIVYFLLACFLRLRIDNVWDGVETIKYLHELFFVSSFAVMLWFVRVFTDSQVSVFYWTLQTGNILLMASCLVRFIGIYFYQKDGITLAYSPQPVNSFVIYAIVALAIAQPIYISYCCLSAWKRHQARGFLFLFTASIVYFCLMGVDTILMVKQGADHHLSAMSFILFVLLISTHMNGTHEASLLERREKKYRRLVESVGDDYVGFVYTKHDSNIYISPSIEQILGFTAAEIVSGHWRVLADQVGDVRLRIAEALAPGNLLADRRLRFEASVKDRDGKVILFDTFLQVLLDKDGQITSIEGHARDITRQRDNENKLLAFNNELEFRVEERTYALKSALEELKSEISAKETIERQLRQSQKMESVGQLAGGVAHDFNNIMTVISGFTELAIHDLRIGKDPSENLERVLEASSRSSQLTNQLLGYARKQMTIPEIINPAKLIADFLKVLPFEVASKLSIENNGCAADCVLAETCSDPWFVKIDPVQLEQIILNLLINARDAVATLRSSGEISIMYRPLTADMARTMVDFPIDNQEFVCISVRDNGTGISPENLGRIFDPFFSTKPLGKGNGLGLSVCYGIVKQYSGYLLVESEVGFGSVFHVLFPRCKQEPTIQRRDSVIASSENLDGGNETLLLVEDDPAVAMLTEKILASAGYKILTASNGLEALDVAEQYPGEIDLLVTDVMMPKMDGSDLINTIKLLMPDIAVLCLSGYAENEVVAELRNRGVTFLQKPYTPVQLSRLVRGLLNGRLSRKLKMERITA